MERVDNSLDKFLPFGGELRDVLLHPSIKERERREVLRSKGVFLNSNDNENSFPFLLTSLLTPSRFEYLKDQLQTKEDRDKTLTRVLDWDSNDSLISSIPNNFDIQEIVKTNYPKYHLNGTPNFKMVGNDPNKITLDFKCETLDYSNVWYRGKNEFNGQVYLEKVITEDEHSDDKKVQLQITYTSPETMDVADKVSKKLEKTFKDTGKIKATAKFIRVLFKDFTNEERVKFFLNMTNGNEVFNFKRATFLDIGPDPSEDLPESIDWLELAKVKELNINGEILHEIHFIKNKSLHRYMEISEMEVVFQFEIPSAEGECYIRFGFHNYFSKRLGNIELTVDVNKIYLKDQYKNLSQKPIRSTLLKEFEIYKTKNYESIKAK